MTRPVVYDQLVENNNQTNANSTQAGFREMIEASNNFLSKTLDKMENLYRYMFGEECARDPIPLPPANCIMDDLSRLEIYSRVLNTRVDSFIDRIGVN